MVHSFKSSIIVGFQMEKKGGDVGIVNNKNGLFISRHHVSRQQHHQQKSPCSIQSPRQTREDQSMK